MILGCDPGITGAYAILDMRGDLVDYMTMPVREEGTRKVTDVEKVFHFLRKYDYVAGGMERVSSRPGQGVTSMFNFGRSWGMQEACMRFADVNPEMVTPQRWKAHHGILLQDKEASRNLANTIWDEDIFHAPRTKAKGIAVADAALIALYILEKRNSAKTRLR